MAAITWRDYPPPPSPILIFNLELSRGARSEFLETLFDFFPQRTAPFVDEQQKKVLVDGGGGLPIRHAGALRIAANRVFMFVYVVESRAPVCRFFVDCFPRWLDSCAVEWKGSARSKVGAL